MSLFDVGCYAEDGSRDAFEKQRERMVKTQIERRGVKDANVLAAMRKVARHRFVPPQYREHAYEDRPLPIGEGQTISQPYIVALMTEALKLDRTHKVLEIGAGSGYQAAILAEICDSVYTIEIVETLGKRSQKLLAELGYTNCKVKIGDGYKGWEEHSPFDAVIVTCAPSHVPRPLIDQMAEGGRMVIPVDAAFGQELILLTKKGDEVVRESIIPVRFVPMTKEDGSGY